MGDKMNKKTRSYSTEFKREAVEYALNAASVVQAAKELGIPDATLHTWVQKAKKSGESTNPATGDPVNIGLLIDENQSLKKRLARLEQEKAILKKAAAYFAKELE